MGKNCLFAAQVGIGGKTIIEDKEFQISELKSTLKKHVGKDT